MIKKMLFLSLLCIFSLQSQEFQPPITISNGEASIYPQIAFNQNGLNAIAVWNITDGAINVEQAAYTLDGGVTWSAPMNISLPDQDVEQTPPQVAFGNGLNAIATWSSFNGVTKVIQISQTFDGGVTWQTPKIISDIVESSSNPLIAFNKEGSNAIVVWQIEDFAPLIILKASSSGDQGESWNDIAQLNDSSSGAQFFNIGCGSGGDAIVAWCNVDSTVIQIAKTTNSGIEWSLPIDVVVATGVETISVPHVAFGQNQNALVYYAFFSNSSQVCVQTVRTTDSGNSWLTPVKASPFHDLINWVSLAFGDNGNPIVVWSSLDGDSPVISFIGAARSLDAGNSWEPSANISNSGDNVGTPQISFASGLNAIAIWTATVDLANAFTQISTTTDGGANWSSPVNISAPETLVQMPQIAVSTLSTASRALTTNLLGAQAKKSSNALGSNLLGDTVIIGVWSGQKSGETTTFIRASSTLGGLGFSAEGRQVIVNGLFQRDIVNQLAWSSMPDAKFYTVKDNNNVTLFQGNALSISDHAKKYGVSYTYLISWTDNLDVQSPPLNITLP
jgi:hypothetical protein